MSTIHTLRRKWAGSAKIGLIVVVGLDSDSALRKMADKVGGEVYLDAEGDIINALGGKGVPHWWVLDSDNKVLTHSSGYYKSADDQIKRLGL